MLTSVKSHLTWFKEIIQELSHWRQKNLAEKWKPPKMALPGDVIIFFIVRTPAHLAGKPGAF